MPTEPLTPKPNASDATEDVFYSQLGSELERLRTQLVDLDARRRAVLECEERQRAERAGARESGLPGMPE